MLYCCISCDTVIMGHMIFSAGLNSRALKQSEWIILYNCGEHLHSTRCTERWFASRTCVGSYGAASSCRLQYRMLLQSCCSLQDWFAATDLQLQQTYVQRFPACEYCNEIQPDLSGRPSQLGHPWRHWQNPMAAAADTTVCKGPYLANILPRSSSSEKL